MDTGLDGKVALVTGVNNPLGIGAATAEALAAEGAAVFATCLRLPPVTETSCVPGEAFYREQNAKAPDEILAAIRARGGRIEAWEADLADPEVIPQLFDRAEAALGPVDILVNNAALCEPDTFVPASRLGSDARAVDSFPMGTITARSHDRHFAVNSRAVALLMAEYARRHVERNATWGRIVNVSTDGASGFPTEASYGASKHALESYSRAAAAELGRFGITVNVISLGPVQTGWIAPAGAQQLAEQIPLGRIGTPEEAADAIVFFASRLARWVTGQLLYVGGGHATPL
jgi:3-oxoacyl-[acyl-carrier protein] reductase